MASSGFLFLKVLAIIISQNIFYTPQIQVHQKYAVSLPDYFHSLLIMVIKTESYKIFSKIYCPIVPAPLELFFGDGCRSVQSPFSFQQAIDIMNRKTPSFEKTNHQAF